MSELTGEASPGQGEVRILEDLKSTNYPGVQKHQLLQTTARFSPGIIEDIEKISEANGISRAETIRRLVRLGLATNSDPVKTAKRELENLLNQTSDPEVRQAICTIQSELLLEFHKEG